MKPFAAEIKVYVNRAAELLLLIMQPMSQWIDEFPLFVCSQIGQLRHKLQFGLSCSFIFLREN